MQPCSSSMIRLFLKCQSNQISIKRNILFITVYLFNTFKFFKYVLLFYFESYGIHLKIILAVTLVTK